MTRPPDLGRPRSWTDPQFRQAVAGPPPARSMSELARRLGLWPAGPTNRMLREHATRLRVELPNGYRNRTGTKRPAPSGADRGREAR